MSSETEKAHLFSSKSAIEWQEYDPVGNICKSCLASCCNKFIVYAPVLFITVLLLWSYFAYVLCFCLFTVPSDQLIERVLFLVVFHILFVMLIWTYATCIFTPPTVIPAGYRLTPEEVAQLRNGKEHVKAMFERIVQERELKCAMRTIDGLVRHCDVCQIIKPDRAHHCSICRQCVPKMDHHCPWIANCVGFHNYKHFILLLAYTSAISAFEFCSILPFFIPLFTKPQFVTTFTQYNIVVLLFIALIFFLAVLSLLIYHLYLIIMNLSTLEACRAPVFATPGHQSTYDQGALANVREVCGPSIWCWLLPIGTSAGDAFSFRSDCSNLTSIDSNCNANPHTNRESDPGDGNQNAEVSVDSTRLTPAYGSVNAPTPAAR